MADKKEFYNSIIKPTVVLLAICIIIPLALALTNMITEDKIAKLSKENEMKAMSGLIKADKFNEKSTDISGNTVDYYEAEKGGETVGYIFVTDENGYGGTVSVMTAVGTDGTVEAIEILDVSNETPGLGQNAAKESFYGQFSGKQNEIELKKGETTEANQVSAVTGATITSTAVTECVNRALEYFGEIGGGEEE